MTGEYMPLKLDRPPSLTEAVMERLSHAIVTGQLKPGQRLIENDLSATLGISRAPLREAMRALANNGLIELRRGRGAVVASPSDDDMEHMVLFRALIEGTAARLIASRRDPEVIARLAAILEKMAQVRKQRDQLGFLNCLWKFHATICASSGNPFLVQAWNVASNLTKLYMHRAIATINHDEQLVNNGAILNSLRNDSPGQAEQVTRGLLIRVAYAILKRPVPSALKDYVDEALST